MIRCALVVLSLSCTASLLAKDLGKYGPTVPIKEENLLQLLRERSQNMTQEEAEELQSTFREKAKASASRPAPVALPKAVKYRAFYYDPTITVNQDILDHEGNVIAKQGTKLNPLDKVSLATPLLFFDADDPQQLSWAKKEAGKWILTNGAPIELEQEENRPVYFDQRGALTGKFGITAVPAKVTQRGGRLLIEETIPEES